MHLVDRVRRTIRTHDLARRDTRVVVALSGGPDSVALAHLLIALENSGELRVAGFAHLNHQLRAEANADAQFCRDKAASLGRPILIECADVAGLAAREHRSVEDAAHRARYEFLERARQHLDADVVALGHTRDDQAETFLLRLLRGAGARGLAAMHPVNETMVRPLIDCRRADLRAYLDANGLAFVHDQSNDDVRVPRNRVRAELLPLLEQRFNPSIVDVLADEAALARDEWLWMNAQTRELATQLGDTADGIRRLDAAALNELPTALARVVMRQVLNESAGGRHISFAHVEKALELSRRGGVPIDLPGQRLKRVGTFVVLTSSEGRGRQRAVRSRPNLFEYSLSIPGEVWIAEMGGLVSAEVAQSASSVYGNARNGPLAPGGNTAIVQLEGSPELLRVRNRRPGDRFRPFGLGGGKKLQDFFVDRKVARDRRDAVPLVVDSQDRIVWVAGHGIDERFRVMDPAQAVVVLRLK